MPVWTFSISEAMFFAALLERFVQLVNLRDHPSEGFFTLTREHRFGSGELQTGILVGLNLGELFQEDAPVVLSLFGNLHEVSVKQARSQQLLQSERDVWDSTCASSSRWSASACNSSACSGSEEWIPSAISAASTPFVINSATWSASPPPDLGEHDDRLEVFIKDAAGGLVQVAHARNTDPPHGGDEQQDRTKAGEEFRGNGKAPAYRGNAHVLY